MSPHSLVIIEMTSAAVLMSVKGVLGTAHREEVTERYVRKDFMRSVLCALALALSPELLKFFQQGPRGTEEKGVLLGDGVVKRRVIAMTVQPVTENRTRSAGELTKGLNGGNSEQQAVLSM